MAQIDIYEVVQAHRPYICFENAAWDPIAHTGVRQTNFDGHPNSFGSTTKFIQVQIPEDKVSFFNDEGVKVSSWEDKRTGDPVYCVDIYIDYRHVDWYPVNIYVKEGNNEIFYDEPDIKDLQGMDFEDVAIMARKGPKYDQRRQKIEGQYKLYLYYAQFTEIINPFMEKYGRHPNNTAPANAKPAGFDMPAPDEDETVPFN